MTRRRWLVATLVVAGAVAISMVGVAAYVLCISWYTVQNTESEDALRLRLEASGGLPQLKAWISSKLVAQKWDGLAAEAESVDYRNLGIVDVYPVVKDGQFEYFVVEFGGAMRHYGLLIGRPGFAPAENEPIWPYRSQWCPEVWFYDEGAD